MKVDTSGIDLEELARTVGAAYGLRVASVAFLPVGEDAYNYLAVAADGERRFVRAQRRSRPRTLEPVYAATHALRDRCGLSWVVAPYPSRAGGYTVRLGGHALAAFPFVEGVSAFERGLSDAELERAAALLAALHASAQACAVPLPAREAFDNPFERPILRALEASASDRTLTGYRARVRALLLAEQDDLLETVGRMRRLRHEAWALPFAWAPTHGDPNLANILVDATGELHVTDWGELALGPPERDLSFFTGERFEQFLRRYAAESGTQTLHPRLFEFYAYRWALQEVADYATRLLLERATPEEEEHAWTELQPYLPIRHGEILAGVAEVERVLRRVLGDHP